TVPRRPTRVLPLPARSRRRAPSSRLQAPSSTTPSLAPPPPPPPACVGHAGRMSPFATYELDGHVATITYNRPEVLNAINAGMRRDLNDAFARFRDEADAWVAIVTGAGRAFCAGGDIRDGVGAAGEFPGTFWEKPTANSFESGWEIYKPVIA